MNTPAKQGKARLGLVLGATDFSDPSLHALDYAAALLERFEGTLHLVYVEEPDYAYAIPALLETSPVFSTGEIERHNRAQLTKLCSRYAGSESTPPCHATSGRAFDEICKLAAQLKADLIVIATRGLTGVKHALLGSTAERVVRHAACPVLVVRQGAQRPADARHIERIVVPVDFSEFSRAGAERAVFFAQATGATVSLVHVIHVFPAIPTRHVRNYEHIPGPGEIEQAANAQLREFVKSVKFEGVPHEAVVRTGGAADTICDYADEVSADLIVMTTHGRTGLPHVVIGSVAEHIVRYARCPVLIVPQGERSLRRE